MTADTTRQDQIWPMPKFHFEVDLDDELQNVAFQEVSGMDLETQIIEYRSSNVKTLSTIKMPGLSKYGNVTMKRGIFVDDNAFWNWYKKLTTNTIKRGTVRIRLLDETGKTTMQWELHNAWPTKITSADLKSDNNEIAIDTLEIAHEGLQISNGS